LPAMRFPPKKYQILTPNPARYSRYRAFAATTARPASDIRAISGFQGVKVRPLQLIGLL